MWIITSVDRHSESFRSLDFYFNSIGALNLRVPFILPVRDILTVSDGILLHCSVLSRPKE